MDVPQFQALIADLTRQLDGRPIDADLADWLNTHYGAGSPGYETLANACRTGVAEGWLCQREGGGIRYGRVIKPTSDTHGFSVDVVDMADLAGPHHVHPNGEIDLIMPITPGATFDGHPAGWCVYGPGTAHRPTVAGGRALVLYLLPEGAIEFTRSA
ncbi:DUF4863 family protein [Pandoraea fibrosis]|uniref:2-hydroxylaminobenzoate mutase n=1 Tax=Pandoraea fibrosis TaxID=1891094 RepID=A0A5E4YS37_9BURK|nr:DUF4863 family protein [Pandoraea fibrosis]QHE93378.1 DUF4863 family protein [Pandoraea fibrosis]QHF13062.1 DUF4863 family protein [Pandoraea fibrosis]VVE50723.1 2-hydroxylaminobenzoate mutase [Pandoraea fibrosis]